MYILENFGKRQLFGASEGPLLMSGLGEKWHGRRPLAKGKQMWRRNSVLSHLKLAPRSRGVVAGRPGQLEEVDIA
ncbi:hypothetical protein TorRG33x02_062010, partial [Trema orientale]